MSFCDLPKPEPFNKLEEAQIVALDTFNNPTRRILELVNLLQLQQQDYYERKSVQGTILRLLKDFYPNCEMHMFGSSVNGIGCKGCDLDLLFVPFPEYCNEDSNLQVPERIPNPMTIYKNPHLKEVLLTLKETCHLKFVQKVFYSRPLIFEKVIFIPAKCPILNIKLKEFNFECDLSASNKLVVRNSELIKFYGSLDSRVRPLIFILRYWAKSLGLIQKTHLSSYAFCFMVIFALQNTDPPMLPSVKYLMKRPGKSFIINGWETAFQDNVENISKNENVQDLFGLLFHFFDFFWKFDFVQNIVSPYRGKPWPIAELCKTSDEKLQCFLVNTFSIQDPFILSHNISRNASMKTVFKLSLLVAKDLIMNDKFCFKLFFNPAYYQRQINSWHAPKYDLSYLSEDSMLFPFKLTYHCVAKSGLADKSWIAPVYEKVARVIYDVLQHGLLMECEIIEQIFLPKVPPKRKNKKGGPFRAQPVLLFSIQCIAYHDTWNGRRTVTNINPADCLEGFASETLKKEYAISQKLLPVPEECSNPPIMIFQCNGFKYCEPEISDLIMVLRPLTKSMQAFSLGKFLQSYVPRTVDSVFSEIKLKKSPLKKAS